MRTQKTRTSKEECLWLFRMTLIFLFGVLLGFLTDGTEACTYDEALQSDWGDYNYEDVVRILNEDMTEPSQLAMNQKAKCLIGDMRDFYDEFDKVSGGIKYEALTAISAMETGHFCSDVSAYHNNVGGMRNSSGYMTFSSKQEGIQALSNLLVNEYLKPEGCYYEGNTIVDVGKHYNQSVHWVNMYVKVRLDMERRIEDVEPEWTESEPSGSNTKTVESVSRCEQFVSGFVQCLEPVLYKNGIESDTQILGSVPLWTALLPSRTWKKL